jgi:DNA-binding transcriptional MerR regulator
MSSPINADEHLFKSTSSLPRKHYYSIGEVASFLGVDTSVIRYWESEFPFLQIKRNANGERRFTESDIKDLQLIYYLLKHKGFTIEGANKYLCEHKNELKKKAEAIESLKKVKSFLQMLRNELP